MSFTPRTLEELTQSWPPELDHFSASSAKMAVRCPEQWRQRYVQGKRTPPALAIIGGRADHQAIESSMVQKIESGIDLPLPEVRETYVGILEREVDDSGGLNEIEIRKAETQKDRVKAYDFERKDGANLVAMYHREASPYLQPVSVEKEFEIWVPGLPVKVVGRIDLIANIIDPVQSILNTAQLGPKRMIDRKRRGKASRKVEPEWQIQAEVYQYAEPLPHDWHLSIHTTSPQVMMGGEGLEQQVRNRKLLEKQLQHIVGSIGFYFMKYGPDEPWPAQGRLHPWACSYCGYKPECWAWQ